MRVWSKWRAGARNTSAAWPYTMERTGEDSAEIVLYGDIVSERPTDWDGNPMEGQYIILSEFLKDLEQVEDVTRLTVRIHSAGGNAYDALAIHNRLKSMPAEVTVIVDGVAMSGGSLIMCAGDRVLVYPGTLIMIHNCRSFLFGGYNAAELRKIAENNDATDRTQAAIYQAKTGIDPQELLGMMEAETYMTGQEAIDKGFADELMEGSGMEVAASADRRTLYVGGRPIWTSVRKNGLPAAVPTVNPGAKAPVAIQKYRPAMTGKGGNRTMENTESRREASERTAQPEAEARAVTAAPAALSAAAEPTMAGAVQDVDPVQRERRRIQEIDALASLYDEETIQAAKYGEHACTAQEMAYRAAQKAAKQGRRFLEDIAEESRTSGAQQVGSAAAPGDVTDESMTPERLMAQGRADAKALEKKEEK